MSSSSLTLANVVCLQGNAIDKSRVDVVEVDPNFMMATLILSLETHRAVGTGKGAMIAVTIPHTSDRQTQVRLDERFFDTPRRTHSSCCYVGTNPCGNDPYYSKSKNKKSQGHLERIPSDFFFVKSLYFFQGIGSSSLLWTDHQMCE